jgi:predicted nucleic acid-binding protein
VRLILDASAAIEVAFNRGKAKVLAQALEEADLVMAPDLFVAEVVNTVWKYRHFEDLSETECDRVLDISLGLVDELVPCKELYRETFLLARAARMPAYDMFYLALACREDAALLTLDAALKKQAAKEGIRTP